MDYGSAKPITSSRSAATSPAAPVALGEAEHDRALDRRDDASSTASRETRTPPSTGSLTLRTKSFRKSRIAALRSESP
jgi:hypothetical protein